MDIIENPFTEALLDELDNRLPEDQDCLTQAQFDARYGELPW